MNRHDLVSQLIFDKKGTSCALFAAPTADSSLRAYLPELVLCLTILVLLAIRLPRWGWRVDTFWIALIGSIGALYYAAPWDYLSPTGIAVDESNPASVSRMEIFTGMLVYDTFSV